METKEKSLLEINKESIFYKIKKFFYNLFKRKKERENIKEEDDDFNIVSPKEGFMNYIKKIEDDTTILLKLQQRYRRGEIKEEALTEEQINSLCELYDKQISELRKTNEIRKKRIMEYQKK